MREGPQTAWDLEEKYNNDDPYPYTKYTEEESVSIRDKCENAFTYRDQLEAWKL